MIHRSMHVCILYTHEAHLHTMHGMHVYIIYSQCTTCNVNQSSYSTNTISKLSKEKQLFNCRLYVAFPAFDMTTV